MAKKVGFLIICTCFGFWSGFMGLWAQKAVNNKMYIVDRIEEDLVIVEWSGGHFKIPRNIFNFPVKEGDVLKFVIEIDHKSTENRRRNIRDLLEFDEY